MKSAILFFFCSVLLLSCQIEAEEINYGSDACHFCKMTIVDAQHAAQIVTKKGKSYKYDAVECLLSDLPDRKQQELGLIMVNDYNQPGIQISAVEATFLISEAMPSPMGANLSAFSSASKAADLKTSNGGQLYDWETIQKHIP